MASTWWRATDRLFVPWVLGALLCATLMWTFPGDETIPYHVAWIALALAYAKEAWPWRATLVTVAVFTALTGVILVARAASGVIAWEETAEIPLMSVLVLLVLRNVHTRQLAHTALWEMSERELSRAARRERLSRMTSHEMRTPATIAIGYTDALLLHERDTARRGDLEVIRDELQRLVRAGDRAVRTLRVHDRGEKSLQAIDEFVAEVAQRWSVLVPRSWRVTVDPVSYRCSPERLRACLDTLVENAVRYTEPGDIVRLAARAENGWLVLGVADSGPGMHPLQIRAINRGEPADRDEFRVSDIKAQTGLGLAMVDGVAAEAGGHLRAGVAEEGGALVEMVIPLVEAGATPRLALDPVSGQVATPVRDLDAPVPGRVHPVAGLSASP